MYQHYSQIFENRYIFKCSFHNSYCVNNYIIINVRFQKRFVYQQIFALFISENIKLPRATN